MIRPHRLAAVALLAAVAAPGCRRAPLARPPLEVWPELSWYHWGGEASHPSPAPVDTVRSRLETPMPPGYTVFADEANAWSEWLRFLPLAAAGTPVRDARGRVVVAGDDEHLAGVVAIDLDGAQNSLDLVVRLNAEWRWNVGDVRMLYLSDDGRELALQRWASPAAPAVKPDEARFRTFLHEVLANGDARTLRAESVPLVPAAVAPGAFFLRADGEALIVLDVASTPAGDRAILLARARDPAESLHVIRPSRASAWFPVRVAQPLVVPRGPVFQWNELRSLKRLRSRPAVACEGSLCPKPDAR